MTTPPDREPIDAHVVADDDPSAEIEETVDGEPVLDPEPRWLAPAPAAPSTALTAVAGPAVQVAAAAATGFVAGAATLAIVRRREARRTARHAMRRRPADGLPILGTRSFLIDVHMLRGE